MLEHIEAIEQSSKELAAGSHFDRENNSRHMLLGDDLFSLLAGITTSRPILAERHWQFLLGQVHGSFSQGREVVPQEHSNYPAICVMLGGTKLKIAEKSGVVSMADEVTSLIDEAASHPMTPSEVNLGAIRRILFFTSQKIRLLDRAGNSYANHQLLRQLALPQPDFQLIQERVDDIRWDLR